MDLKELTETLGKISDGYAAQFGIKRDRDWALLKMQEELGEIAACHLSLTGRNRAKGGSLADEVADLLAMTLIYAREQNIDIEAAIQKKWMPYLVRTKE